MSIADLSLSDRVEGSETLYTIAENLRAEKALWPFSDDRATLEHAATQLEHAARRALTESTVYSEAWALEGTRVLRKFVAVRRFIECWAGATPTDRRPAAYITLDCRDGQHRACHTCGCHCHGSYR